jgi:hypothetical protein
MILGSTLVVRSGEVSSALTQQVHELWGAPLEQLPPSTTVIVPATPASAASAAPAADPPAGARLDASKIAVRLELEHRQKGLLWFPTYRVDFSARYTFSNPEKTPQRFTIQFPLQSGDALYDGFEVLEENGAPVNTRVAGGVAAWPAELGPNAQRTYLVKYRSRGTSHFQYQLSAETGQVRDFELALDTNFPDVDFPSTSLSPSMQAATDTGWRGEWKFKTLLTSAPIGVELPQKLNPGPLASRITFFAPVGLLFFFFVVAILGSARKKSIHPMNYFFLGCGFFAFHLLFSYLVDHLAVAPAFAISSAVSMALVTSYARLFVGWRFALREIGISQFLYLVLFSFTFFWTGFTGLTITVGAIATLFLMMQITGRRRWDETPEQPDGPRGCSAPYRCGTDAEAGA